MSEVKLYDQSEDSYGNSRGMKWSPYGDQWSPYGDYVLASDCDQLMAENERLRLLVTEFNIQSANTEIKFINLLSSLREAYEIIGHFPLHAEDTMNPMVSRARQWIEANKNHE